MATIQGTSGNDFITGGFQNDLMNALAGADTMVGGKGSDTYYVDNLGDIVVEQFGEGVDTVVATVALGTAYANVENYDFGKLASGVNFTGNGVNNEIKGTSGIDTLAGGTGGDTYYLNSKQDVVVENFASGSDTVAVTFGADLADYANVENIRLLGSAALNATGYTSANKLDGNSGANILNGKGGADTMTGGKGNDTYHVDDAGDIVTESAGEGTDTVVSTTSYELSSNVEKLILAAGSAAFQARGNSFNNTIIGNESDNFLDGKGGADTMAGGEGNDAYGVDHIGDKIIENAGGGTGDNVYSSIDFSLASLGNIENLLLTGDAIKATGNAQNNRLYGNAENNALDGGAGADSLYGAHGNDTYYVDNVGDLIFEDPGNGIDTVVAKIAFGTASENVENYDFSKLAGGVSFVGNGLENVITGGAGIDTLSGFLGDDTYYLNNSKDVVIEASNAGNDTIATTFSAALAGYMNIENIRLLGSAALNATGNGAVNQLEGNSGANILDGKGGADALVGGKGNDTYYVDNPGDIIVEYAKEGVDTVIASIIHTLDPEVEKLIMAAGAGAIGGTGNALNNTIVGNEDENSLNGAGGADTLKGGDGNDSYYVDHVGDKIVENANEGTDRVHSMIDFSLATLGNVEYLELEGTALKGTGNALENIIYGNDQDNTLDGRAGADFLKGGKGNDTYYIDHAGDVVQEAIGEGIDTIVATVALGNVIANVENYDFSKLASGVNFIGDSADNEIKGSAGADTLAGGKGDDTYYLNSKQDQVFENGKSGIDTIATIFSADLDDYPWIENIRLLGSAALNATGHLGANVLEGNTGANVLDGKGGADTMAGGKGNDTYYVDDAGDVIVENAKEGTDTVISSVAHTLDANVESLTLAGVANISGIGNDLNNVIVGNEGNNTLSGLAGADTMKGGKGDDIYYVENAKDKVVENAGEGSDGIVSALDFSLAGLANVENLLLLGSAKSATGNAQNNLIYGNAEHNTLNGGAGADTMTGSLGNDIYHVDNAGDLVSEQAGEGTDTIVSTIVFNLARDHVENYDFSTLTSGLGFTGNSLDNEIKGGAGVDTLIGGLGNDTYFLNSGKDVVVENAAAGTDTIAVTFNAELANYADIENIRLLGTAGLKATGNIVANLLEGNIGANILDGKAGADTMRGGKGNDTYHVDNAGDQVLELAGEGTDTVISAISHTLDANVENLILADSAADATGNALGNVLVGNEGDNILDGKAGADTMRGGKGDDRYYVDYIGDKVVENADEGEDRVLSSIDFSLASLVNVEELQLTGTAMKATGNARNNFIVGNDLGNVLDGGAGADELVGLGGDDIYLFDNIGDTAFEVSGEGQDTIRSTVAFSSAFAYVENYDFSKAKSAVDFTGNDIGNVITSSAFNDTLAGGDGSDHYYLNNAGDRVVELAGQGKDTAHVTFSVTTLWDNVENLVYADAASTKAWNATGNGLDNYIEGNAGNNILDGALGADFLYGGAGNDTLTGGGGGDYFLFDSVSLGGSLSGHDVITDFDRDLDSLSFSTSDSDGDGTVEQEDFVAGIVDHGAGQNVLVHLLNGGSITFTGVGTGSIASPNDLVSNPAQIDIP